MNTKVTVKTGMWMAAALIFAGCAGTVGDSATDSDVMLGAEDEVGTISSELSTGVPVGSQLKTTSALNLRTGAGTGYRVRLVIPNGATVTTINRTTPSGGWYNVKYNGITGWSYGSYLKLVSSGGGGGGTGGGNIASNDRNGAILRAKSGVGFSYYWGHGSWIPNGASSSTRGSCVGSCPGCRHSGRYGADCSGYVGKIWEVPSSNTSLTTDSHPYSTVSFKGGNSQWRTVSRASILRADAMVYNTNGAGHIFLFESGDGWGSMWAYEAKGCSPGIVRNIRTASTAYKAIRRTGY
jgi:hypothetical protein